MEQNEAYNMADCIYEEVSGSCKVSTENSAQNMLSQRSSIHGDEGIEIVYDGVKDTVSDIKGSDGDTVNDLKRSDGESSHCVSVIQGSDGESDYYVNDP